jgi:hypothetical protein
MSGPNEASKKQFEPMRPIGLFLGTFGVAVCAAPLFVSMVRTDVLINLACGLTTLAIGAIFFIVGWRRIKSGVVTDASQWQ